jgi:hypothetical protein
MKKILLFLIFFKVIYSQSYTDPAITKMFGLADSLNNSHLFYELNQYYTDDFTDSIKSDLYHFDVSSKTHEKVFSGYQVESQINLPPYDIHGRYMADIAFINNDPSKFIILLNTLVGDVSSSILLFDGKEIYISPGEAYRIFVSKVNPNYVYVNIEGKTIISKDGGYTWPSFDEYNSTNYLDFNLIGLSPKTDSVMFGIDNENRLIRTENYGNSSIIVNDRKLWNLQTEIYFDPNTDYVYGLFEQNVFNEYSEYYLYSSNKNGDPYTWDLIRNTTSKLNLLLNENSNGIIYLSQGNDLYQSDNYGTIFTKLFSFKRDFAGIFYESIKDEFYYSTVNQILTTNLVGIPVHQTIFQMPITKSLDFMPLQIGNSWTYHIYSRSSDIFDPSYSDYYKKYTIVDTAIVDGNKYYKIDSPIFVGIRGEYLRIGEENGIFYTDNFPLFDFTAVNGDTLETEYFITFFTGNEIDTCFGEKVIVKKYTDYSLTSGNWKFAQGIGMIDRYFTFDFGYGTETLVGAVIDGKVYGDTTVVSVKNEINIPNQFDLSQNYPNPFNPSTMIEYSVPSNRHVNLKVFDILGREVATLVNEQKSAGSYQVNFNAENIPSGVYIYKLSSGNYTTSRKMLMIK